MGGGRGERFALSFAAVLYSFRREFAVARGRAEAAIEMACERRLPQWLASATMCRSFALVGLSQQRKGIAQLQTGMTAWHATGSRLLDSEWLDFTAEAYRPAEGIPFIETAMRLDPHYPYWYLFLLGHAFHTLERYDEAVVAYRRVISRNPDFFYARLFLAAVYAQQGRVAEAKSEAVEALRASPHFSGLRVAQHLPLKDPAALARLVDGMRKAGVPE